MVQFQTVLGFTGTASISAHTEFWSMNWFPHGNHIPKSPPSVPLEPLSNCTYAEAETWPRPFLTIPWGYSSVLNVQEQGDGTASARVTAQGPAGPPTQELNCRARELPPPHCTTACIPGVSAGLLKELGLCLEILSAFCSLLSTSRTWVNYQWVFGSVTPGSCHEPTAVLSVPDLTCKAQKEAFSVLSVP